MYVMLLMLGLVLCVVGVGVVSDDGVDDVVECNWLWCCRCVCGADVVVVVGVVGGGDGTDGDVAGIGGDVGGVVCGGVAGGGQWGAVGDVGYDGVGVGGVVVCFCFVYVVVCVVDGGVGCVAVV